MKFVYPAAWQIDVQWLQADTGKLGNPPIHRFWGENFEEVSKQWELWLTVDLIDRSGVARDFEEVSKLRRPHRIGWQTFLDGTPAHKKGRIIESWIMFAAPCLHDDVLNLLFFKLSHSLKLPQEIRIYAKT